MKIRPGELEDAQRLASTEALARADGWEQDAISSSLEQTHIFSWVGESDEEIIAHVISSIVLDEAEILTIAVNPEYRRKGYARDLLRQCYQEWRASGVRAAYLEVRTSNHGARALYQNCGWVDSGTRKSYYRDGESAIVMRWEP
jgi:ribosomal-protein-alanine N-acetyltransferase